jgi:maltose O-acetyltransferase
MKNKLGIKIILKITAIVRDILFKLRDHYYHAIFNVGENTTFLGKVNYYNPQYITIGNNCSINEGVFFNVSENLLIGDNVALSANVFITDVTNDMKKYPELTHIAQPIFIKDHVWVGAGAIIMPGVTIGKNSVISAGSVVTRSIPSGEIWFGNPARPIGKTRQ